MELMRIIEVASLKFNLQAEQVVMRQPTISFSGSSAEFVGEL